MAYDRSSLQALKNILAEVDLILETAPPLPQNRTGRSRELLRAALALADDLVEQDLLNPAALMGHKGGSATARKLGADHLPKVWHSATEQEGPQSVSDQLWS